MHNSCDRFQADFSLKRGYTILHTQFQMFHDLYIAWLGLEPILLAFPAEKSKVDRNKNPVKLNPRKTPTQV